MFSFIKNECISQCISNIYLSNTVSPFSTELWVWEKVEWEKKVRFGTKKIGVSESEFNDLFSPNICWSCCHPFSSFFLKLTWRTTALGSFFSTHNGLIWASILHFLASILWCFVEETHGGYPKKNDPQSGKWSQYFIPPKGNHVDKSRDVSHVVSHPMVLSQVLFNVVFFCIRQCTVYIFRFMMQVGL